MAPLVRCLALQRILCWMASPEGPSASPLVRRRALRRCGRPRCQTVCCRQRCSNALLETCWAVRRGDRREAPSVWCWHSQPGRRSHFSPAAHEMRSRRAPEPRFCGDARHERAVRRLLPHGYAPRVVILPGSHPSRGAWHPDVERSRRCVSRETTPCRTGKGCCRGRRRYRRCLVRRVGRRATFLQNKSRQQTAGSLRYDATLSSSCYLLLEFPERPPRTGRRVIRNIHRLSCPANRYGKTNEC
jgi:hypothetical protein